MVEDIRGLPPDQLALQDGREAPPVMSREPVQRERCQVIRGTVALVALPRVRWMVPRQQLHQAVAHGFGDHGRGGDRVAVRVAVVDRVVRAAQLGTGQAVHQNAAGRHAQAGERAPHGEDARSADVDAVDLTYAGGPDAHRQRARAHHAGQPQAARGREQLRVAQTPDDRAVRRKHDGRGHHRTGEGTAACFIDTGDESAPRLPERDLALERGAGTSHASCFSVVSGTTTPRFSRIRAALPARRRRKYSLARRTRPLRSSSISAIAGECSGKIRSTPTPAEMLRTVNVSLMPPPRRPMHTPSNACRRSLSPSRTRTITRTVSPGSKAVRFVLSPSRSIVRNLSITLSLDPLCVYASARLAFSHKSGRRSRVNRSACAARHPAICS